MLKVLSLMFHFGYNYYKYCVSLYFYLLIIVCQSHNDRDFGDMTYEVDLQNCASIYIFLTPNVTECI